MTIKHPPKIVSFAEIVKDGVEDKANRLSNLMSYHRVTDDKGRYHHWDDFQYRVEKGVDAVHAWSVQKMARLAHIHYISYQDKSGEQAKINVLPSMHKACSLIDQQASKAAFEAMISNMEGVKYLIRELREESRFLPVNWKKLQLLP